MAKRKVMVELRYQESLAESAFSMTPDFQKKLDDNAVPRVDGVLFDLDYAPTVIPRLYPRPSSETPFISGEAFDMSVDTDGQIIAEEATYLVRGEADEDHIQTLVDDQEVLGVYADVQIQSITACPSGPRGTTADVERLLHTDRMHSCGMDGSGVTVAIVDSGINLAHMIRKGKDIDLDEQNSWVPSSTMRPGEAPVGHGTMCAFDAAIAAPNATYLDIQLLRSRRRGRSAMEGLLSDAVSAYSHLLNYMAASTEPGENRSLVVNNSWGMYHPSWDLPAGHPGNYSDNPNHPFNRIVTSLERAGADILFAAGNCGSDCPSSRCRGITDNSIYGANGHPAVLCVAGVDVNKRRIGYSTQGPGRLSLNKPDISGYTHFSGSGVHAADSGTSAATPVVAGVVAALRSKRPYVPGNPASTPLAIRNLMRSTAEDLGTEGYDFDHGFGVVNGKALAEKFCDLPLSSSPTSDLCEKYPIFCLSREELCRRYPVLCGRTGFPARRRSPFPTPPIPVPFASTTGNSYLQDMENMQQWLALNWLQNMDFPALDKLEAELAGATQGSCECHSK